jgi:hypothetical protein
MILELLDLLACCPLECACPPLQLIDFCCSCFCPSLSSLSQLPCEGVLVLSNLLSILVLLGIGLELLGIGILIPLNACLSFGMLGSNCLALLLALGNGWCSLVFKEVLHLLVVNLPKLGNMAKGICTKHPCLNRGKPLFFDLG